MLKLTDQQLEDFRQIVEAESGEPCSLDDARAAAQNLFDLYRLLCRFVEERLIELPPLPTEGDLQK